MHDSFIKKNRLEIIFIIFTSIIFFVLSLENYFFLTDKNSLFFEILPNSSVADSYYYYKMITDPNYTLGETIKIYLSEFNINLSQYRGTRPYPRNYYSTIIYYKIFNSNFLLFSLFNFFIYLYVILKLSNYIKINSKIYFLIFNILNLLILGSLSLPNKEIIAFFSFTFFLISYLSKKKLFFFISIFFSLFTRFELTFVLIITFILLSKNYKKVFNNNFFLTNNYFLVASFYLVNFVFFKLLGHLFNFEFLNLINGGVYNGLIFDNLFSNPITLLIYLFLVYFLWLIFKIIFNINVFKLNYIFLPLCVFVVLLNHILPNYYWFIGMINDITAFQTENSLGITLFLYNAAVEGYYFLVFPIKIAFTLFSGALQTPSLASYETIFSYISQWLFLIFVLLIVVQKKINKSFELSFVVLLFMIIFSLPAISVHRYLFFIYEFFLIIYFVEKTKFKTN